MLATILLLGVFIRHNAVNALASESMPPAAVFYVLGGAWEVILCAVILAFTLTMRPSIWRTVIRCAAAVGIVEGAQITGCRLAIDDIRSVPRGTSLCDHLAGWPIGAAIQTLYLLLIVSVLGRAARTA